MYNGIRYKLKVFNKKFISLINKFNLETETENIPYEFKNTAGEVIALIYGEKTDELNYTQVEIPCMPHHKEEYDLAVKTQLLFFDNIKYYHESVDGYKKEIEFKSKVHYNGENLIIADGVPFNKPYVVVINGNNNVGVCYGFIDFKELELQEMYGSVGVKCKIRQAYVNENEEEILINPGIEVTSSRENVRWTPNTREYLLSKFTNAQEEASLIVEKELQETDFIKWLKSCGVISSGYLNGSALSKLAKIIDTANLNPKFSNTNIKYSHNVDTLFKHFSIEYINKKLDKVEKAYKIEKESIGSTSIINWDRTYFLEEDEKYDKIKSCYLTEVHNNSSICLIRPISLESIQKKFEDTLTIVPNKDKDTFIGKHEKEIEKRELILELCKKSELYKSYKSVEVPEDYSIKIQKIEEGRMTESGYEKEVVVSAAQRREMEQRTIVRGFEKRFLQYGVSHENLFKEVKYEPKIEEIGEWENVYYGFDHELSKFNYACGILGIGYLRASRSNSYDNNPKLVLCSEKNKKYFRQHKPINDFFGKVTILKEDNKLLGLQFNMENQVIKWNTARKINATISQLTFFNNFEDINSEMRDLYIELYNYCKDNYTTYVYQERRLGYEEHHEQFCSFLDNLEELQKVLETTDDAETIKETALKIAQETNSDFKDLRKVLVIDSEIIAKFEKLLTYANPIKYLCNSLEILTLTGKYNSCLNDNFEVAEKAKIPLELKIEIENYINLKHN